MRILFKYMNEPRGLFETGYIRLTQLCALNDPFEASYCKDSLNELSKHFDEETTFDYENGRVSFSDYVENKLSRVGVISLSENKENLLMWAHYANEHKGLVAGIALYSFLPSIFQNLFRADTLLNNSDGDTFSPFNGRPHPVSYRKGLRYRNDKFDYDYSNLSAESADRLVYEVCMQKSDEWIYEQEHRVVLRLEQADRVILPDSKLVKERYIELLKNDRAIDTHENGACTIHLNRLLIDYQRIEFARELAKLSYNPDVIYLMQLNVDCINNCLLGLKSNIDISDLNVKNKSNFDAWQATKNSDYYSLEFTEI